MNARARFAIGSVPVHATSLAPAELHADLFVQQAGYDQCHDLAFAPGQRRVPFPEAGGVGVVLRNEIYRIGYEAILNASAHSRASRLSVELEYGQNFSLRIPEGSGAIP